MTNVKVIIRESKFKITLSPKVSISVRALVSRHFIANLTLYDQMLNPL